MRGRNPKGEVTAPQRLLPFTIHSTGGLNCCMTELAKEGIMKSWDYEILVNQL